MRVALQQKSFPAPQPATVRGEGSIESCPRRSEALRRVLGTDIVRRSGALLTFFIAVVVVMASAGGVLAQEDSDNDGLDDGAEAAVHGTDPNNGDTDLDGLSDGVEVSLGTNPLLADSDGDGASDAEEYLAGDDPLVGVLEPVSMPVTAVPTTVGSGSEAVSVDAPQQAPVTVSPPDSAFTGPLAFSEPGTRLQSRFFPLYLLIAVSVSVGMAAMVRRIPALSS